ncbi:HWE histidine kinase domain-containing protein [Caulobacter segnis]
MSSAGCNTPGQGVLRRRWPPCAASVGAVVSVTGASKRAELPPAPAGQPELNHRVKNSLATIQAIAAQSLHSGERAWARRQEAFSNRIVRPGPRPTTC